LILLVAIVLWGGGGRPAERLLLSGGGAWLASPERGFMTLIDGPSAAVVANVAIAAGSPGEIQIVQAGNSALVVNDAAGTVGRIDVPVMRCRN
jgi:uncharacterized protein (AIM24 family)